MSASGRYSRSIDAATRNAKRETQVRNRKDAKAQSFAKVFKGFAFRVSSLLANAERGADLAVQDGKLICLCAVVVAPRVAHHAFQRCGVVVNDPMGHSILWHGVGEDAAPVELWLLQRTGIRLFIDAQCQAFGMNVEALDRKSVV